jgi:hypothetical protein
VAANGYQDHDILDESLIDRREVRRLPASSPQELATAIEQAHADGIGFVLVDHPGRGQLDGTVVYDLFSEVASRRAIGTLFVRRDDEVNAGERSS